MRININQPCYLKPHTLKASSRIAPFFLLFSLLLPLVVLLLLESTTFVQLVESRTTSKAPTYRPIYPPYHTYQAYKDAILAYEEDVSHRDYLRMQMSREKTFGGEYLYLMQLSHFHKTNEFQNGSFIPPRTPKTPTKRPTVLLSFGEHAREFITIESFFHLLDYLLAGSKDARTCEIIGSKQGLNGVDVDSRDPIALTRSPGYRARWTQFVLNHLDLHLLGVTNPDGKVHIEQSSGSSADYCWRNTGRGIDLNRNADWEFNGPGSSMDVNSEEYHGPAPFSEAETRFLRDLQLEHHYTSYVSVHSGEQQLFVPFVDTVSKQQRRTRATRKRELEICERVVKSPKLNGWLHDSGVGYEMNDYSADGTLMDYMAGKAEIPLVFTVELWGGPIHDDCFVQFNPDPKPIIKEFGAAPEEAPLIRDLHRMHIFYIELFNAIIYDSYGIRYRDPLEVPDSHERTHELEHLKWICEVEQELYEARKQQRAKPKTTPAAQPTNTNPFVFGGL